ncbi:Nn.00g073200.m01.CDS01 [Neocucurbitaria sp. VM-36]
MSSSVDSGGRRSPKSEEILEVAEEQIQAESDQMLGQLIRNTLVPGFDHSTALKVRSPLTIHNNDIRELSQATEEFMNDRHDGECNCLDGKVAATILPGENFVLSEEDKTFGRLEQHPTTKSLFDLIDQFVQPGRSNEGDTTENEMADNIDMYVDVDALVEADTVDDHPDILKTPPVEMLFNTQNGLPQRRQDNKFGDDVFNMADDEVHDFSMSLPSDLTYFDADAQKSSGYTAFNQLLHVEEDGMYSGIHRDDDDDGDAFDFDSYADVLEVVEQYPNDDMAKSQLHVTKEAELVNFDFDFACSRLGAMPQTALTWSDINQPATLHPGKHKKGRPQLTLRTRLEPIAEEEEDVGVNSASSEDSLDFADRRQYVKPLARRRADFLDDEDDPDDGEESIQSSYAQDVTDTDLSKYASIIDDFFSGEIWHIVPSLTLIVPALTPP